MWSHNEFYNYPYFTDSLFKEIKATDCFGVSFDESMKRCAD